MKYSLAPVVVGAAALMAITSCANGDAEPTPTVTVTETVTATPEPESGAEEIEEVATDEGDGDGFEPAELNERGNIPVSIGSEHGLFDHDGDRVVEWSTVDLEIDPQCNSGLNVPPEGRLIALTIEISVDESYREFDRNGFRFTSFDFEILNDDGIFETDRAGTEAAINCLDPDDELTVTGIRPGVTETGTIILESPVDSGYMVFWDYVSDGHYEWEF